MRRTDLACGGWEGASKNLTGLMRAVANRGPCVDSRDFLKLAGATSAGLALSACGLKATEPDPGPRYTVWVC